LANSITRFAGQPTTEKIDRARFEGFERFVKFRDFTGILLKHGFTLDRQRGSHRQYKAVVNGKIRLVTVAGRDGDDIQRPNLASMIRQSGLSKKLFR